jgi:hypothetical protein
MKSLMLLTLCLGICNVCRAQSTKPKADSPAPKVCGMSEETLNQIEQIANLMDTDNKPADSEIESVYEHWESYLSQAKARQDKSQSLGDLGYAYLQLAVLWGLRAKYDEIHEEALQRQMQNVEKLLKEPTLFT